MKQNINIYPRKYITLLYHNNIFDLDAVRGNFSKETQFNLHTSDWQQTKPYLDHLEKYDAFGGIYLKVSIER